MIAWVILGWLVACLLVVLVGAWWLVRDGLRFRRVAREARAREARAGRLLS